MINNNLYHKGFLKNVYTLNESTQLLENTHQTLMDVLVQNVGNNALVKGTGFEHPQSPTFPESTSYKMMATHNRIMFSYLVVSFSSTVNMQAIANTLDNVDNIPGITSDGIQYALYVGNGPTIKHKTLSPHVYLVIPTSFVYPANKINTLTSQFVTTNGLLPFKPLSSISTTTLLPMPIDNKSLILHNNAPMLQLNSHFWLNSLPSVTTLKNGHANYNSPHVLFNDFLSQSTKTSQGLHQLRGDEALAIDFIKKSVYRLRNYSLNDSLLTNLIELISNGDLDKLSHYTKIAHQFDDDLWNNDTIELPSKSLLSMMYPEQYTINTKRIPLLTKIKSKLGDDFICDNTLPLVKVIDLVLKCYHFIYCGHDSDNIKDDELLVFDESLGLWTSAMPIIKKTANILKPGISSRGLDSVIIAIASSDKIDLRDSFSAYTKGDYFLFRNGVLNIHDMDAGLIPLSSSKVRELHFTTQSLIDRDFKLVTKYPKASDGSDWNLDKLFTFWGYHDPQLKYFLYFVVANGMFPSLSATSIISIQGASGSGKSTFGNIWDSFYGHTSDKLSSEPRTVHISFNSFTNRFGLSHITKNTVAVVLNELNEGVNELNEESTSTLDGYADKHYNVERKGKAKINLRITPQLLIEGTALLNIVDADSGPSRRIWAYELPTPSKSDVESYYAQSKQVFDDYIQDSDVIMCIFYHAMKAYKTIVPASKFGSSVAPDKNSGIPIRKHPKLMEFKQHIVESSSTTKEFFEDYIVPYIHVAENSTPEEINKATLINVKALMNLQFDDYYKMDNPSDPLGTRKIGKKRFKTEFNQFITKNHWTKFDIGPKPTDSHTKRRLKIGNPKDIRFDWPRYNEDYHDGNPMPKMMNQSSLPAPFGKLSAGWFVLMKKPQ